MIWHARRYPRNAEGPDPYESHDFLESTLFVSRALLLAAVVLLIGGRAVAQDRPASEEVGSWPRGCPDSKCGPCRLRLQSSIVQPDGNGPPVSFEAVHRGDVFVPAVALRGPIGCRLASECTRVGDRRIGLARFP